ncbi:hypothetical protein NQ315_001318 [Exocentrus adspersus]|uniref:LITAF domain-containing protein n=1 Tax=Exocentrus adspersus TaxID=1586481 RepID=A0AAV8WHC1_9CUCU|nr:hypothetical protein NQ315_001318 [Exocentrus adspersus]
MRTQSVAYIARAELNLGRHSTRLHCPFCTEVIETIVITEPTKFTHIAAGILCVVCFPCAWTPYFIDSCQRMHHYCPKCQNYIGTYKK